MSSFAVKIDIHLIDFIHVYSIFNFVSTYVKCPLLYWKHFHAYNLMNNTAIELGVIM